MAEPSIDELFAAISETRRAHDDAATPAEKTRQRTLLDSLRAKVASHSKTGLEAMSLAQLKRRIDDLTRRLDQVYEARLDPSISAGPTESAGGGIHPVAWAEFNRRVDELHGRHEIEAELVRLEAELNRRRQAPTSPD